MSGTNINMKAFKADMGRFGAKLWDPTARPKNVAPDAKAQVSGGILPGMDNR